MTSERSQEYADLLASVQAQQQAEDVSNACTEAKKTADDFFALLLTGKLITAATAHEWGMVNRVVEKSALETEVNLFAQQLIANTSAQSLARTKRMIAEVQHLKLEEALDFAAHQNAEARTTEDYKKGIDAFLNKEELTW